MSSILLNPIRKFFYQESEQTPKKDVNLLRDVDLRDAIFLNKLEDAMKIISENPSLISLPLKDGELPLQAAVRLRKSEMVQFLISRQADPFLKNNQGMTALDYALVQEDMNIVRLLLPTSFLQQLDKAQLQANGYKWAEPSAINIMKKRIDSLIVTHLKPSPLTKAIEKHDISQIKELLNTKKTFTQSEFYLAILLGNSSVFKLLLSTLMENPGIEGDFSWIDDALYIAAYSKNTDALQQLLSINGNISKKNNIGVSAVDMLFFMMSTNAHKNDPLNFNKMQFLLGLISLGSIVANYSSSLLDVKNAYLWQSGLALLSAGSQLAISYQAYLQLNPQNTMSKVLYWGTALATTSSSVLLSQMPGVPLIWDIWRTCAVAKRAIQQMGVASNNFAYEPIRAIQLVGNELLSVSTTIYHTLPSFKQVLKVLNYTQKTYSELENLKKNQQDLELRKSAFNRDKSAFESDKTDFKGVKQAYERDKTDFKGIKQAFESDKTDFESAKQALEKEKINLTNNHIKFSKFKKDWEMKSLNPEKKDICKLAYEEELSAIKKQANQNHESFIKRLTHPSIGFLLSPKVDFASRKSSFDQEREKVKSAVCILFGSTASSTGEVNTQAISRKEVNAAYKQLALLYHPDKCGEANSHLQTICSKAFTVLEAAKSFLTSQLKQMPLTVSCPRSEVSFTVSEVEVKSECTYVYVNKCLLF